MKRGIINEIVQTLYPDDIKCIVCGKEIHPNRYGLCNECSFDLNDNFCLRCGRHKVGIGDYCSECSDTALFFDEARSSVSYDDTAKNVIGRLKYGSARYLVRPLCEYLLDTLLISDWDFDCFTFVPMHKSRQRKRGYNQAELLARELAERTTTPCFTSLQKTVKTPNQARLDREARIVNLDGAFEAVSNVPKHIVLIDDVMTTGSTVNECSKTLKRAGAKVVYVLTFASVPERPVTDRQKQNIGQFRG